jgi:chromosome segregation ATPase
MDYIEQLDQIKLRIEDSKNRISELNGAKNALLPQRQQILSICKNLGIEPKREAISDEIERCTKDLSDRLKKIDQELKKEI